MLDLPRSVCFCKPCQPTLDTKEVYVGTTTSMWGVCLMALPSVFGCLGVTDLIPS
jgi:hypothetical protein